MTEKTQEKQPIDWNALIAHHPVFDVIDTEERAFLLSDKASRKHVLKAGEVVLKQGETGTSLYVICEGAVTVILEGTDGKPVELYTLRDGEVFGEMALFGQRLRAATLVTAEPCKLLEIAGDVFLVVMQKHHEIALYLLAKLSQRLHYTDEMILTRRLAGTDSSVAELKTRLDVVTQTTDAKLTAAQTMYDQTSKRAGEIIASAGRARTRLTWMASTATVLLGLLASAGFWNFKDAQREIIEAQQDVEERAGAVAISAAEAKLAAGNAKAAAEQAGGNATSAQDSAARVAQSEQQVQQVVADARRNAEEIGRLRQFVNQTKDKISKTYYDNILLAFKSDISLNRVKVRTAEGFIEFMNDAPQAHVLEMKNLLYQFSLNKNRSDSLLELFKQINELQLETSLNSKAYINYFTSLTHIVRDERSKAKRSNRLLARTIGRTGDKYEEILGSGGFDAKTLEGLVGSGGKSEDLKQQRAQLLAELFDSLRRSP